MDKITFNLNQNQDNLTQIEGRGFIKIKGADRFEFLQGLITQDVFKLKSQPLIYSCFLTPQGRYLFDFFIFEDNDALVLDLTKDQAEKFFKKLKIYKLRSKVSLELLLEEGCSVSYYVGSSAPQNVLGGSDPRKNDLGHRLYNFKAPKEMIEFSYDDYRYASSIIEGDQDMIQDKSTLLECRMDELNAVDFKKGCYIGQELTARTHYRGLLKRKLYHFSYDGQIEADLDIIDTDGKTIGTIRSNHEIQSGKGFGFALMKVSEEFQGKEFDINGLKLFFKVQD